MNITQLLKFKKTWCKILKAVEYNDCFENEDIVDCAKEILVHGGLNYIHNTIACIRNDMKTLILRLYHYKNNEYHPATYMHNQETSLISVYPDIQVMCMRSYFVLRKSAYLYNLHIMNRTEQIKNQK